jgi:hypothetical protein
VTTPSDPNQPNYGYQGLPNFPNAPQYNQQYNQMPQVPASPPSQLMIAFWLYVGAAVVGLVSGLLYLGDKQTVLNTLRTANNAQNYTDSQLQTLANATVVLVVVFAVIFAALYLLFAFKLRAGRNWARIVLTILAVLNLLSILSGRSGTAVGDIAGLAVVIGTVLSYLPQSSAYIAAVKASRRMR